MVLLFSIVEVKSRLCKFGLEVFWAFGFGISVGLLKLSYVRLRGSMISDVGLLGLEC